MKEFSELPMSIKSDESDRIVELIEFNERHFNLFEHNNEYRGNLPIIKYK